MVLPILLAALVLVADPPASGPRPADSAPPAGEAFDAGAEDLSKLLAPIRAASGVPAMAVAVITVDGPSRIIGLGADGVRSKGSETKASVDDLWHLGSCTKAFTATLCGVLVDAGRLRWESTVGELLGPEVAQMHPRWRDVRLDELLRHRGGAPAAAPASLWSEAWNCTGSPCDCRKAFVAGLLAAPPERDRGAFAYSNQGYAIAGRMCEIAGGAPWEELVRTRVCEPLGITTLGFGVPSKRLPDRSPKGHAASGAVSDVDNPPAIAPAGTMHMTIADWARFVALHAREEADARVGITAATLHHLHEAPPGSDPPSAMGWMGAERPWGGAVLTHSGSNNSWFCVTWLSPSRRFAVLVTANQGGDEASRAADRAAFAAIQWWQRRSEKQPPTPPTTPSASPGT